MVRTCLDMMHTAFGVDADLKNGSQERISATDPKNRSQEQNSAPDLKNMRDSAAGGYDSQQKQLTVFFIASSGNLQTTIHAQI